MAPPSTIERSPENGADRPARLLSAVLAAFPGWMESRIVAIARASGRDLDAEHRAASSRAAERATTWLGRELGGLLATDVDVQGANPLHVMRRAARFAAEVLEEANVPLPTRDEFEGRAMPDDVYGVGPLAWRDLGDAVHDAGIEWGAWKAAMILARRRDEGRR